MSHWNMIQNLALDNYGLVTTSQAAELGVKPSELSRWTHCGRLEKRTQGLFRLVNRMPAEFDRYAEALAIVGEASRIHGESVLAIHNLAMVNPAKIEVASPRRIRKAIPTWIKIVGISASEGLEVFDGISCQPLDRAILACVGRVPGDRLLAAVGEARSMGLLSDRHAKELRKAIK